MTLPSSVFWEEVRDDVGTMWDGSEDVSSDEGMRTFDFWGTCGSVVEAVQNMFGK
jgi:hypothetical protein